jgi:hypothetical protein
MYIILSRSHLLSILQFILCQDFVVNQLNLAALHHDGLRQLLLFIATPINSLILVAAFRHSWGNSSPATEAVDVCRLRWTEKYTKIEKC